MVDLPSPPATRLGLPRWLDLRLVAGVLLVLVSVVTGARVLASAEKHTRVYVASRPLAPGQHLVAEDLEVGRVRLYGQGDSYVSADGPPPVGYLVTRFVGAREFVPGNALSAGRVVNDTRLVAVPVPVGHLPSGLGRGDLVDVYVTSKPTAGTAAPLPQLVLARAAVDSRETGARGLGGTGSTVAVQLSVPVTRVASLVRAVQIGTIDLVRLPAEAAGAAAPAGSTPPAGTTPTTEVSPATGTSLPTPEVPPALQSPPATGTSLPTPEVPPALQSPPATGTTPGVGVGQ